MGYLTFKNIGISGISAVVPKNIIKNNSFIDFFEEQDLASKIASTGIEQRRFVNEGVCASDLCIRAAEKLIVDLGIEKNSIDMLIFLSQTPDYRQPATAPSIQHRLGLPKTTASFDINLACSGYIYGLSTAFSYCQTEGINRVLLLVGETLSKITSPKDKATMLLFGDAGTATLIEKKENTGNAFFSLNSDGSGAEVLSILKGGYRFPSSMESLLQKTYEDGSIRCDENLFMDGMEVFNFTMREIPKDIKSICEFAKEELLNIDYLLLHQANKFMTDFFVKKLKFPPEKVPYCLQKFGNTSAVSIPLTIVSELKADLTNSSKKVLMSGFGGGLSWGSVILNLNHVCISELSEF